MSVRTVIFKSSDMKDKDKIPKASEKQKGNINPSKFLFLDQRPLHKKKKSPDTCKNVFLKEELRPMYCVHQS